jgi:hypothetical protein
MMYSEGALIREMQRTGVGRPSTYASTLRKLRDKLLVTKSFVAAKALSDGCRRRVFDGERGIWSRFQEDDYVPCSSVLWQNSSLVVTDIGRAVLHTVALGFPYLLDAEFTRNLEADLDNISSGGSSARVHWLHDVVDPFVRRFLQDAKSLQKATGSPSPVRSVLRVPTKTIALGAEDRRILRGAQVLVLRHSRFGPVVEVAYPRSSATKPAFVGLMPLMRHLRIDDYLILPDAEVLEHVRSKMAEKTRNASTS